MSAAGTAALGAAQPQVKAAVDSATSPSAILGALTAIATYLPAEGFGIYIAIAAQNADAKSSAIPWAALAAAVLVNAVVTIYSFVKTARAPGGSFRGFVLLRLVIATLILTVLYISAVVGNPLQPTISIRWTSIIALIIAAVLPFVAKWLGLTQRVPT